MLDDPALNNMGAGIDFDEKYEQEQLPEFGREPGTAKVAMNRYDDDV
jgi:hypothetical protein